MRYRTKTAKAWMKWQFAEERHGEIAHDPLIRITMRRLTARRWRNCLAPTSAKFYSVRKSATAQTTTATEK
ncbi:MAG: hypothetical protein Q7S02_03420 [bacterium]|nr:hypothetical protein [bacterium]